MTLPEQLIDTIIEVLDLEKDKLTLETDFFSDLNLSRLEVIDLILLCQQKLNLNLNNEDFGKVHTVHDLIKLFEETSNEI